MVNDKDIDREMGKRLKDARELKGLKPGRAAKKLRIDRSTLWNYEKGRIPKADFMREAAALYGVDQNWLLCVTEEKHPPDFVPGAKPLGATIPIPVLGYIPAGLSSPIYENILYFVDTPEGQVKASDCFYLRVNGDSMTGSRICDGDLVLVRRQPEVENGEIAVVRTNAEEATLKRVKVEEGTCILYPDNPDYKPIIVDCDEAHIIGKVIKVEFDPNKKG